MSTTWQEMCASNPTQQKTQKPSDFGLFQTFDPDNKFTDACELHYQRRLISHEAPNYWSNQPNPRLYYLVVPVPLLKMLEYSTATHPDTKWDLALWFWPITNQFNSEQ